MPARRSDSARAEFCAARKRIGGADAKPERDISEPQRGARAKLAADPSLAKPVNARLIQSERQLIDPDGLPRRPWYRHLFYAPGFYTGYGVKTMPGVRESIEQKQYAEAEREIGRVARALDRETALINAAATDLERIQK